MIRLLVFLCIFGIAGCSIIETEVLGIFPASYGAYTVSDIPSSVFLTDERTGELTRQVPLVDSCRHVRRIAGKMDATYGSRGSEYWKSCISWLDKMAVKERESQEKYEQLQAAKLSHRQVIETKKSNLSARLPRGYRVMWDGVIDYVALDLALGRTNIGALKGVALRADSSNYMLSQVLPHMLIFKHRMYPHKNPFFAAANEFSYPIVGNPISSFSGLWEIYGVDQLKTVLGASQQVLLIRPVMLSKLRS